MYKPSVSSRSHFRSMFIAATSLSVALFGQTSSAGGFQLSDQSVTSLGRAHAGYGVVGDDASAVHYNPAGLTLLKKSNIQFGFAHNDITGELENNGSTGFNTGSNDDGAESGTVPNLYYTRPISDKLSFGIGLTAPFGTHTDYSDDFFGRYNGLETELVALDLNPVLAYELNDRVSIGGGLSIQKLDVTLSRALSLSPLALPDGKSVVEGDSTDFGFNLGVMLSFDDGSRLGLSYRSAIEHDIEGDATTSLPSGNSTVDAESFFESPATAYIGYYKDLTPNLFLTAGARWTEWSSFREIRIEFPASDDDVTDIRWDNSWTYMVGIDGKINKRWGWRAGLAFDESPVPDSTRSVRTIDADRTWYALGASYKPSKKVTLDFAYRYIDFDSSEISQQTSSVAAPVTGLVNGEFNSSEVHTFAAQINYQF